VTDLSDQALHGLLRDDVERGWRAFVDQHTPVLLGLIRRAGVVDRDEALDVYVRVCRHLAEGDCERLRRHDPAQGSLRAWLAVVVRHVIADWVRSRAGRRRLFAAVRALPEREQRVFELYYWEERTPSEIVELLRAREGQPISLADVLEALDRVYESLSQRQLGELVSLGVRARAPEALETADGLAIHEPPDTRDDPERALRRKEAERTFGEALGRLTPEEAAIVRLKFVQGLTHREIQRALHLDRLSDDRVKGILARLRALLTRTGAADPSVPGLAFLDGSR
jgi:DNA-directed RNA polymerase specialized sigma24 family protein